MPTVCLNGFSVVRVCSAFAFLFGAAMRDFCNSVLTGRLHGALLRRKKIVLLSKDVFKSEVCAVHIKYNKKTAFEAIKSGFLSTFCTKVTKILLQIVRQTIIVRDIRFFSKSTPSTFTSTTSPTFTTSNGCFTNFLFVS